MNDSIHEVALTLDVDWAPDVVIDFVAQQLLDVQVPATWFVTHKSPAIDRLGHHPDLFELGIHPNLLPGSTHGKTLEEVMDHCLHLVPQATSMRTHGLVQSTHMLSSVMRRTPIRTDVSLYLPHACFVHPVEYWCEGKRLLRVPYVWEDDLEMERPAPVWHPEHLIENGSGIKVFDFHPIHIYLNSANMRPYQTLKRRTVKLSQARPQEMDDLIHHGDGTRTCFYNLLAHATTSTTYQRVKDIDQNSSRPPCSETEAA